MLKEIFLKNLRVQRESKGYSQQNMAELLDISQSTYARIERRELDLTLSKIEKIASSLGVSEQDMFTSHNFIFHNCNNANNGLNQHSTVNNYAQSEINDLKQEVANLKDTVEQLKTTINKNK